MWAVTLICQRWVRAFHYIRRAKQFNDHNNITLSFDSNTSIFLVPQDESTLKGDMYYVILPVLGLGTGTYAGRTRKRLVLQENPSNRGNRSAHRAYPVVLLYKGGAHVDSTILLCGAMLCGWMVSITNLPRPPSHQRTQSESNSPLNGTAIETSYVTGCMHFVLTLANFHGSYRLLAS